MPGYLMTSPNNPPTSAPASKVATGTSSRSRPRVPLPAMGRFSPMTMATPAARPTTAPIPEPIFTRSDRDEPEDADALADEKAGSESASAPRAVEPRAFHADPGRKEETPPTDEGMGVSGAA